MCVGYFGMMGRYYRQEQDSVIVSITDTDGQYIYFPN